QNQRPRTDVADVVVEAQAARAAELRRLVRVARVAGERPGAREAPAGGIRRNRRDVRDVEVARRHRLYPRKQARDAGVALNRVVEDARLAAISEVRLVEVRVERDDRDPGGGVVRE